MFSVKPQTPIIDWSNPLTKGLEYSLSLKEGASSNVFDDVKKRASITVNTPSWKKTVYGNGLGLVSASSQYIDTLYPISIGATESMTVSILAKISSAAGTGQRVLFGSINATGNFPEFMCGVGDGTFGGRARMYVSGVTSGNSYCNNATVDYRDDTWHLFTFIRNGSTSTISILVDGVQVDSVADATSGGITFSIFAYVGVENNTGAPNTQYTDMDLALVLVHKRALSITEVKRMLSNPWEIYKKLSFRKSVLHRIGYIVNSLKLETGTFLKLETGNRIGKE